MFSEYKLQTVRLGSNISNWVTLDQCDAKQASNGFGGDWRRVSGEQQWQMQVNIGPAVQQFSSSAVEHKHTQTAELEMRDLNDLGHLPRRCWLPSTAAPALPPSSLQIIQARDGKINSPHDNLAHRSQELYFQRQTSDLVSLLDLKLT